MSGARPPGERKRVLWVNQFALLPRDGGGTRQFELGRELGRLGWDVTILAADLHIHRRTYTRRASAADKSDVVETLDGVTLRWLWSAPYLRNNWRRAWNWLTFWWSVVRAGRAVQRPDVVIGSSPQLFAAHAALRVARWHGVPFVFEVRDLWPEGLLAAGGRRGIAYWVLSRLARHLYARADRILVLAVGTRDYLVERGISPQKVFHVPNGVDVHAVTSRERREPSGATDKQFTFVYAGAHGPVNGLETVLAAAALIGKTVPAHFLLVGDGPIKEQLVALANSRGLRNVEFRGAVSKPELTAILNEADAGLMILRSAPLFSFGVSPNKLFDYLAAGLPVLCNVPGEVAGMVASAGAGIQLTAADGAALADGVRAFVALDETERKRMGRDGRAWVEREHSREVLGERLHAALTDLYAGHSV